MHFRKFADFGSGKWSSFLFSLNVWALLHNLSDHRYISCGKIWHHIHHGSNYAEKTKKKEREQKEKIAYTQIHLDTDKRLFYFLGWPLNFRCLDVCLLDAQCLKITQKSIILLHCERSELRFLWSTSEARRLSLHRSSTTAYGPFSDSRGRHPCLDFKL